MRVVAGELRGRRLTAPRGQRTRPTSDKVREALFAILGEVAGAEVLDLYAGSGALGIEALSRGAARAEFVDDSARAVRAIRDNLERLGLAARVHQRDALSWLAAAGTQAAGPTFDLVFADPPYDSAVEAGARLAERLPAVIRQHAVIVTESDKRAPLELPFPLVRERTYGDTRIAVHRHG